MSELSSDGGERWKAWHRILVIDPGWENLGVFLLEISDPAISECRFFSTTYDLDVRKSTNLRIITSEVEYFFKNQLFLGYEETDKELVIDYLVIEKQPSAFIANRELQICIQTVACVLFSVYNVVALSPITVKKRLGLKCNKNHDQNKKDMYKLVKTSPEILFQGDYDYNVADCVGLLNVFLRDHKRIKNLVENYKIKEIK